MAKLTLSDISILNDTAVTAINSNNTAVETAMEKTLSRDGTAPNEMEADLDMNDNRILNLALAVSSTEPVRLDQVNDLIAQIFAQSDEPSTDVPDGSLWIDTGSDTKDLYIMDAGVWTDTSVDFTGATGETGPAGATGPAGPSQDIFAQNSAPATSGELGSLWIDADSTDLDLYQLTAGPAWTDTGVNLKGATGATGSAGAAATIAVGTVTTVAFGNPATVTNVGTSAAAIFDFDIPSGQDGMGAGDVTAAATFDTDNVLIKSDGTSKGVQSTGITVADTTNDMSGVGALGTTTIELGHASDTTLARVSAGVISVEGVTVPTISSTSTLTNKTVNLANNTVTGTTAEFNTALSDNDFATLAGTETLTNKTLTAPIISTISNTGTVTLPTATDTLVGKATTDTFTNKTIDLTNNTLVGSVSEFNAALESADFYTSGGTDVIVADGGTGLSSATAYAVLCGGTTSTGAFQSIAGVGTATQVLTSNGAGALPTFQDAAAGGGGDYVLLTSGTVSAAATLDIVLTSYTAYRGIVFYLSGFRPATDAVTLGMRVSTNGGSSYDTTGYANRAIHFVTISTISFFDSATDRITLSGTIGNDGDRGYNGTITILNQTSAAFRPQITHVATHGGSGGYSFNYVTGSGTREALQDTDAVRFLFSSGNITAGNYAVYGIS